MEITACAVFPTALTNSVETWQRLSWWKKVLVKLHLKRRPVGQIEAIIMAMES